MSVRVKNELIYCWSEVDKNKKITISELRNIFGLTRILLENRGLREAYPVLYLYCDWSAHSEIDRNSTGRAVITEVFENNLRSVTGRSVMIPNPITGRVDPHSISIAGMRKIASKELRREWLSFYSSEGINVQALNDFNGYYYIFKILLESLCQRPISLGPFGADGLPINGKNRRIYEEMVKKSSLEPWLSRQIVPLDFRVDYGFKYIPPGADLSNLKNDGIGCTLQALADGYVWVVRSLPSVELVLIIMFDELPSDFIS